MPCLFCSSKVGVKNIMKWLICLNPLNIKFLNNT